jgi:hypothetical protein
MKPVKVFGLGFHKTGTTSLETALAILGYSVVGMKQLWDPWAAGDRAAFDALLARHDGFRDMPIPLLFRELDARFPEARFVLTLRDPQAWMASCRAYYRGRAHPMFPVVYGVERLAGNERHALAVLRAHEAAVRAHFADRPGKLLEVDWSRGDGWAELCGFLGEPVPDRPFPVANPGAYTLRQRVRRKLLRLFDRPAFDRMERGLD